MKNWLKKNVTAVGLIQAFNEVVRFGASVITGLWFAEHFILP